jgi:putative membrane protein
MPGFLPSSRGSFILDFIVVAMAAVVPILLFSIRRVRIDRDFKRHKAIQIALGIILGSAILAFELDMRLNGWKHLAAASPYYETYVYPALLIHLGFAIPTLCLWTYTIYAGIKHRIELGANKARIRHRKLGLWSTYTMVGTTITGWIFYYLAFIAKA